MNGIIIIDKELGLSSHDVVSRLRRILKTRRVGHAGTLDPMASGVLVVMINKATKLSNYLVMDSKQYIATFKLGVSTTTQDLEGEIVSKKEYKNDISLERLDEVLKSFEGKITQIPSIYSAIKVNGKKLYEYARNNEEVEIPSREITINKIQLLEFSDDEISIKVDCSSGTYIRTLCYDISKELGYPGVLTKLRRTQSGQFNINDAFTLEQVEKNDFKMLSINEGLQDYDKLEVNEQEAKDVLNGKPIITNKEKDFIIVDKDKEVLALYGASVDGISKMKRGLW
ncbi:tRNA pseudouridine(55) synthase TruB [Mycoplasma sp. P36-A1]|uniref:tRNA pseudouridine(55) synthase TruB n=1 Tax=Mycoplasma sp. P36-A1 TaxID=3252900 RepID=UPI003C2C3567